MGFNSEITLVADPLLEALRARYKPRYPEVAAAANGRQLVDAVVRGMQREEPKLTYPAAFDRALADDVELRQLYGRS